MTHRSVMTIPTFLIKILLPRVQEIPAAKLECCEYTRRCEYSWKRFWLSTWSTRSWKIHKWFKNFGGIIVSSENRRHWDKWERRTIAVNFLRLWLTVPWILGLVFKAWQFRVICPWRCICEIPWPNGISKLYSEFPSRSLRKGVTKGKKQKLSYQAEDRRMFSAEDNWVLFKKRRL